MKIAAIVLALAATAGCYRHDVIIAEPAELEPRAQRREHAWGHLVENNTIVLTPFCNGAIAKLYQRSAWWSRAVIVTDIYCRADVPTR